MKFLRAHTDRMIKMTVPGPFTMSQQAQNDFYADEEEMALDYAAAVNAEIKDLFAAGADVVQIDEPYMQARPEKARNMASRRSTVRSTASPARPPSTSASAMRRSSTCGRRASSRPSSKARRSSRCRSRPRNPTSTARCCGSCRPRPSSSACRSLRHERRGAGDGGGAHPPRAPHVPAERIVVAPDCGLKYLPREVAFGKMRAMVEGAKIVRRELGARSG